MNSLKNLTGLSRTIALPHEYTPVRFPSFPALERTAVMGFSVPTSWTPPSLTAANKLMIARQAAWPCWADQSFTGVAGYTLTYSYPASAPPEVADREVSFADIRLISWSTGNLPRTSGSPGVAGVTIGLTYPFLAVDSGEWLYVPSNSYLAIMTVGPAAAAINAGDFSFVFDRWQSPGQWYSGATVPCSASPVGAIGVYASTTSFSAFGGAAAGYWVRLKAMVSNALGILPPINTIVLSVGIGATQATFSTPSGTLPSAVNWAQSTPQIVFMPLVTPVEFANTALPWYATRTNAAAVLLTNVTQVLNKAGVFLGGRVSPNVLDPFRVTSTYVATLHPAEKQQLGAEEGFYTFVPPSTDMSNFWDYTLNTSGSVASCPVYRLDNDALVNHVFLTDPVAASFAATIDWHIEFRTSSTLFPIAISNMTLESLHTAQLALAQVGFFYSNSWHLTLKKILGSLASTLAQYHPAVKYAYQGARALQDWLPTLNAKTQIPMSSKPLPSAPPTNAVATPRKGVVVKGKKVKVGKGKKKGKK